MTIDWEKRQYMYSEPSLQPQHLFPKPLPLKWICCFTEYLMSRMICKKGTVLFLFLHRTCVLYICKNCLIEGILTNIQNICFWSIKYNILAWFVTNCYLFSEVFVTVELSLYELTNFVVSSVGMKRVVYIIVFFLFCFFLMNFNRALSVHININSCARSK